jgi:hypothetical protein
MSSEDENRKPQPVDAVPPLDRDDRSEPGDSAPTGVPEAKPTGQANTEESKAEKPATGEGDAKVPVDTAGGPTNPPQAGSEEQQTGGNSSEDDGHAEFPSAFKEKVESSTKKQSPLVRIGKYVKEAKSYLEAFHPTNPQVESLRDNIKQLAQEKSIFLIYGARHSGRGFTAYFLADILRRSHNSTEDIFWFDLEGRPLRDLMQTIPTVADLKPGSVLIATGKTKSGDYLNDVASQEWGSFSRNLKTLRVSLVLISEREEPTTSAEDHLHSTSVAIQDLVAWRTEAIAKYVGDLFDDPSAIKQVDPILEEFKDRIDSPVDLGKLFRRLRFASFNENEADLAGRVRGVCEECFRRDPRRVADWFGRLEPGQKLLALLIELLDTLETDVVLDCYWTVSESLARAEGIEFKNPLFEGLDQLLAVLQVEQDPQNRYRFVDSSYGDYVDSQIDSFQKLLLQAIAILTSNHDSQLHQRYKLLGRAICRLCRRNADQFKKIIVELWNGNRFPIVLQALKAAAASDLAKDAVEIYGTLLKEYLGSLKVANDGQTSAQSPEVIFDLMLHIYSGLSSQLRETTDAATKTSLEQQRAEFEKFTFSAIDDVISKPWANNPELLSWSFLVADWFSLDPKRNAECFIGWGANRVLDEEDSQSDSTAETAVIDRVKRNCFLYWVSYLVWLRLGGEGGDLSQLESKLTLLRAMLETERDVEEFNEALTFIPRLREMAQAQKENAQQVASCLTDFLKNLDSGSRKRFCYELRKEWCRSERPADIQKLGRTLAAFGRLLNGQPYEIPGASSGLLLVEAPQSRQRNARLAASELYSVLSVHCPMAVATFGRTLVNAQVDQSWFETMVSGCLLAMPAVEEASNRDLLFVAPVVWSSMQTKELEAVLAASDLPDLLYPTNGSTDGVSSRVVLAAASVGQRSRDGTAEIKHSESASTKVLQLFLTRDNNSVQFDIQNQLAYEERVDELISKRLAQRSPKDWQRLLKFELSPEQELSTEVVSTELDKTVEEINSTSDAQRSLEKVERACGLFQLLLSFDKLNAFSLVSSWAARSEHKLHPVLPLSLFSLGVKFLRAGGYRSGIVKPMLDAAIALVENTTTFREQLRSIFELFLEWTTDPAFRSEWRVRFELARTLMNKLSLDESSYFRKKFEREIQKITNSLKQDSQKSEAENVELRNKFLEDCQFLLYSRVPARTSSRTNLPIFAIVVQSRNQGGNRRYFKLGLSMFRALSKREGRNFEPVMFRVGQSDPIAHGKNLIPSDQWELERYERPNLVLPLLEPRVDELSGVLLLADTPPYDWEECVQGVDARAFILSESNSRFKSDGAWELLSKEDIAELLKENKPSLETFFVRLGVK